MVVSNDGTAGGAIPSDGGIALSLERMNRIVEVNPVDMVAVVEPGVINAALKAPADIRRYRIPRADIPRIGDLIEGDDD